MIFREDDAWFGVALEFNIVVEGDDPRVVEAELQEAVIGYLEAAKKLQKGFRPQQVDAILNQEVDEEYETMWSRATQSAESLKGAVPSPFSDIYKVGVANLAIV